MTIADSDAMWAVLDHVGAGPRGHVGPSRIAPRVALGGVWVFVETPFGPARFGVGDDGVIESSEGPPEFFNAPPPDPECFWAAPRPPRRKQRLPRGHTRRAKRHTAATLYRSWFPSPLIH